MRNDDVLSSGIVIVKESALTLRSGDHHWVKPMITCLREHPQNLIWTIPAKGKG
jgi:hypothetical protein